jgi:hypothetical protein
MRTLDNGEAYSQEKSYILSRQRECNIRTITARVSGKKKEISCDYYYFFSLTANGFLPDGSSTTVRHNTQITHITQNNTTLKRNTTHKTTPTIKDTLHRMITTTII